MKAQTAWWGMRSAKSARRRDGEGLLGLASSPRVGRMPCPGFASVALFGRSPTACVASFARDASRAPVARATRKPEINVNVAHAACAMARGIGDNVVLVYRLSSSLRASRCSCTMRFVLWSVERRARQCVTLSRLVRLSHMRMCDGSRRRWERSTRVLSVIASACKRRLSQFFASVTRQLSVSLA